MQRLRDESLLCVPRLESTREATDSSDIKLLYHIVLKKQWHLYYMCTQQRPVSRMGSKYKSVSWTTRAPNGNSTDIHLQTRDIHYLRRYEWQNTNQRFEPKLWTSRTRSELDKSKSSLNASNKPCGAWLTSEQLALHFCRNLKWQHRRDQNRLDKLYVWCS